MKLKIIIFSFLIIVLFGGYFFEKYYLKKENPITNNNQTVSNPQAETELEQPKSQEKLSNIISSTPLPSSFQIPNVPFQSQAPFANWDHLHDEACEEASLIMVNYYLKQQALTAQDMENQIQALTNYERQIQNDPYKNLTIAELAKIAKDYYSLNPTITLISNLADLKREISQNQLVIVPAAGRELHNPNFRSPGPVYHMLVVTGYNNEEIITNDPGTRRGQNYRYENKLFFNAIHDWTGNENTLMNGSKFILVFD